MIAHQLSPRLWTALLAKIERANARSEFVFVRVIRVDDENKLIWAKEFGDTPIPLIGFKYGFSYYDTTQTGSVTRRSLKPEEMQVSVPRKGSVVVVVRPYGNLNTPFCIGQVMSRNYWEESQ